MAWFGNQDIQNQGATNWATYLGASKYALSEEGQISSISLYLYAAAGNIRFAIYTDDAGAPDALQCETGIESAGVGWNTIDTTTNPTLPAGNYWLAWQVDSDTSNLSVLNGDANQHAYLSHAWGAFPDPFGTPDAYQAYAYSIYATYGAPPPTVGGYAAIF